MSRLSNLKPRLRDDSEARTIALATKARKELGLSHEDVDWDRLFERVDQKYRSGVKEQDIDWKRMVEGSLLKKTPEAGIREDKPWRIIFPFGRSAYALIQVGSLLIIVFLFSYAFRLNNTISDLRSQLGTSQETTKTLSKENQDHKVDYAKALTEAEQARKASEEATLAKQRAEERLEQIRLENRSLLAQGGSKPRILMTLTDESGAVIIRNGRVTLNDVQLPADISNSMMELAATDKVKITPETRAASALVSEDGASRGGSSDGPTLISPRHTALPSTTPTLEWEAVSGAREYEIKVFESLRSSQPVEVWGKRVSGTEVTVPSGELREGGAYFWQVQPLFNDNKEGKTSHVGFWVLSERAQREIESAKQRYGNSPLVLAVLHAKHGLYEDALKYLEKITDKNPSDSPVNKMREKLRKELAKGR